LGLALAGITELVTEFALWTWTDCGGANFDIILLLLVTARPDLLLLLAVICLAYF